MRHYGLRAKVFMPLAFTLGLFGGLSACSDEENGGSGGGGWVDGTAPRLAVTENSRAIVSMSTVTFSPNVGLEVRISNTGTGNLSIKDIEIASEHEGAFSIDALGAEEPWSLAANGSQVFWIRYNSSAVAANARPVGLVTIRTNRTLDGVDSFSFYVQPDAQASRLSFQPPLLDFGLVQQDGSNTKPLNLLNLGSRQATLVKAYFSGHTGYTLILNGQEYPVTAETSQDGIDFAQGLTVEPGTALQMDVRYTATGDEQAIGKVIFIEAEGERVEATLHANLAGPCIRVNPPRVDFGAKAVGQLSQIGMQIESCGDLPLVIEDLSVIESVNGAYDIDESAIGTLPLTLEAGESVTLPVTYMPQSVATMDATGQFARDIGTLRIKSNAYLANFDVELTGFGTDGTCPTAVIRSLDGDEVVPQTRIRLDGTGSTSNNGPITEYLWRVVQPNGSVSNFSPSATSPSPTFEANIVGSYIFRLEVKDALGYSSCTPAEYTVNVVSEDAIHVELLWRNPTDMNPFDFSGADVDLHFLHPNAMGRYNHFTYDCYYANKNPNWGLSFSPSDDPRLDRDDVDGDGPENLNMATPEQNTRYQVGVHYYDDWGYGIAYTTIRVYIYGQLRDQWSEVQLKSRDLWDSHYIDWPSGVVTRITGTGHSGARITPFGLN